MRGLLEVEKAFISEKVYISPCSLFLDDSKFLVVEKKKKIEPGHLLLLSC